jgi:hypothetical protein
VVVIDRNRWSPSVGTGGRHRRNAQAGWLYELDTIAVSVLYAQAGRWEHRADLWHPNSRTSTKHFQIADFMYSGRAADDGGPKEAAA